MMSPFILKIDSVLRENILNKLKKDFSQVSLAEASVYSSDSSVLVSDKIRKTKVHLFKKNKDLERASKKISLKIQKKFNLPKMRRLNYQYALYQKGDFFRWHRDYSQTGKSSQREFTAIIFLSNENDYTGGLLEVIDPSSKRKFKFKTLAGRAIIFPAIFQHRVTPVLKGRRETLTIWMRSLSRKKANDSIIFLKSKKLALDLKTGLCYRVDKNQTEVFFDLIKSHRSELRSARKKTKLKDIKRPK